MGVRECLAGFALREMRVLIVERPGWALTRIAAERSVAVRGGRVARSAADADALLCCGEPDPELAPLVGRLIEQIPRPRAQERADHPGDVAGALDRIAAALRTGDARAGVDDASVEAAEADQPAAYGSDLDHGETDRGDMADADMDDADMADADMDDADMADADMDDGEMADGGMDMSGPGGIPLAGGDADRDGLEMDVLSVRLGPVLPAWPAGLVLDITLAGDLITAAQVDLVGLGSDPLPAHMSRREHAALVADRIGWVLLLAGAMRAERGLRRVRDGLLDGAETSWCAAELRRVRGRLDRSRALRWSIRGLGRIDRTALRLADLPLDWAGDILDRLGTRLAKLSELLSRIDETPDDADDLVPPTTRAGLELVAETVCGLEIGAARLVIASVDVDLAGSVGSPRTPIRTGAGVPR